MSPSFRISSVLFNSTNYINAVTSTTTESPSTDGITGPQGFQGRNAQTSVGSFNEGDLTMFTDFGIELDTLSFGKDWIRTGTVKKWSCLAISSSGQWQIAGYSDQGASSFPDGGSMISQDYGMSWNDFGGVIGVDVRAVAMSSSGRYIIIGTWKDFFRDSPSYYVYDTLYGGFGALPFIEESWPSPILSIVMSISGSMIVMTDKEGGLYISYNVGRRFQLVPKSLELEGTWTCLAMNGTGQYILAGKSTGKVYLWNRLILGQISYSVKNGSCTTVSINTSGQYMVFGGDSGELWISSNFGDSFIEVPLSQDPQTSLRLLGSTMSTTGQYQLYATTNLTDDSQTIYGGSTFGNTRGFLELSSDSQKRNITGIEISSSGQNATYVQENGFIYRCQNGFSSKDVIDPRFTDDTTLFSEFGVSLGSFGKNWVIRTDIVTGLWNDVEMSSSGQYQTSIPSNGIDNFPIFLSSDYGISWTPSTTEGVFFSIEMSASGQYQAITTFFGDGIYQSSDFGQSWTFFTIVSGLPQVQGVAISASGQYQYIVQTGSGFRYPILISVDYGNTFAASSFTPYSSIITTSASGKVVMVVESYLSTEGAVGLVYKSVDFGGSFNLSPSLPQDVFYDHVAVSATGQYILLSQRTIDNTYGFLTNHTYGEGGWVFQSVNSSCTALTISASGQYQAITTASNGVLVSHDYGHTWHSQLTDIGAYFTSVAMSSSGQFMTTIAYGVNIIMCTNPTFTPDSFGNSIAIGQNAGNKEQGINAIAIGTSAGKQSQGAHAIAIGAFSGTLNQPQSSIILNATGDEMNAPDKGLYIKPVNSRDSVPEDMTGALYYDEETGEIYYYSP